MLIFAEENRILRYRIFQLIQLRQEDADEYGASQAEIDAASAKVRAARSALRSRDENFAGIVAELWALEATSPEVGRQLAESRKAVLDRVRADN